MKGGLGLMGTVKRGRWSNVAGEEGIQLRYRRRDIGPVTISNPAQGKVIQTKISKPQRPHINNKLSNQKYLWNWGKGGRTDLQ